MDWIRTVSLWHKKALKPSLPLEVQRDQQGLRDQSSLSAKLNYLFQAQKPALVTGREVRQTFLDGGVGLEVGERGGEEVGGGGEVGFGWEEEHFGGGCGCGVVAPAFVVVVVTAFATAAAFVLVVVVASVVAALSSLVGWYGFEWWS